MKNIGPLNVWNWNTEVVANNSVVPQNSFPKEIRSPIFNFRKVEKKTEKTTTELSRMYENEMNDEEFSPSNF